MSLKSIKKQTAGDKTFSAATAPLAPIVSSYTVNGIDDTALDPAGGQTVLINGTGFKPGATITLSGTAVSVVSYVSPNRLSFTSPAKSAGTYTIYVTNTDGGTGIYAPGIVYSTFPTWTTASGSIGSYYETQNISNTFVATSDSAIANYTLVSGALPSGSTLYANGVLSGTAPADSGSTTYNFTIKATDAELQDSSRSFSLTINTDTITWSSPANASVVSSYEYSNISNVTLTASSAVGGNAVTYTANSFPTGISLSGNTISGMSNTIANTATLLTATGNATGRNATRTVYFNVQQDVVTWSSPADGTTYTATGGAISNVTLAATSAAGKAITFSANTLPTGVTLNANVISGTPTVGGNTTTLLTATAATTNRNATRTIYWVVNLGDSYWKNVSLLLNGTTPTTTFINDASLNNNQLTIFGDTRPSNFDPYMVGYYSNFFDGTGDTITVPNSSSFAFGTGDFTIEFWMRANIVTGTTNGNIVGYSAAGAGHWNLMLYLGNLYWQTSQGVTNLFNVSIVPYSNAWTHYAIVRVSGTTRLYINGVQQASGSDTTIYTVPTATVLYVGYNSELGYLNGHISNLRIVKGTGLYTAAFTPSTTPLTAVSGTQLLTCRSNGLIDNSLNNLTVTKIGDVTVSSAHPFVTPTTVAYNTLYSTYFDGTGDYVTIPNSAGIQFGTGDFTIEFWMFPTKSQSDILVMNNSPTVAGNWALIMSTNLYFQTYWGSGSDVRTTSGPSLNTWSHIAVVRISGTINIYINGVSAGSGSGINYNGTNTLGIGGANSTGVYGFFGGFISNLRIVKGVGVYTGTFTVPTTSLATTQSSGTNISAITGTSTTLLTCQNATLIDNSSNALTITSVGDARPVALSPFTMTTSNLTVTSLGSAYFDGSGDYLTTSTSAAFTYGTGDFTIEMWVYITANPGDYAYIYSQGPNTTASIGIYLQTGKFNIWNGSGIIAGSTSYLLNTWYHIALARSGTSLKLFLNGVQDGSVTNSSNITTGSTYGANIGRWVEISDTRYFTGYIADCRVIKGTALYTSNFLPPQTPLTVVTNTQLLTLQYNGGATNNSFVDQSNFNNLITRAGNTTQGTFSPYSQTGWSNYFDGSGDELTLPLAVTTALSGTYTIESWCYYTAMPTGTTWDTSCPLLQQAGGSSIYHIWALTTTGLLLLDRVASAYQSITSSITMPSAGQWFHVAITNVGTTVKFYLNGQLAGSLTQSAGTWSTSGTYASVGAALTRSFTGYLSNFRIVNGTEVYTTTFTPPTSPLLPISNTSLLTCQDNRFIDESPNNRSVSRFGNVSVQAFSPFGGITSVPTSYSVYFDGTNDYIRTSGTVGIAGSAFTIAFWFYPLSSSVIGLFDSGPGVTNCFRNYGTNTIQDQDAGSGVSFANQYTVNAWNWMCITKSGTSYTVRINDTTIGTGTCSSTLTETTFTIGTINSGGDGSFNGYISDFHVFNTNTVISVPTTIQTRTANTTFLTCQSATIIDNSTNYFTITASGNSIPSSFNPFGLTNTPVVSYTPTVNGGSMYFDGTGDTLSVSGSTVSFGNSQYTVEFWIYRTAAGSISRLLERGTGSTDFSIDLSTSGTLTVNNNSGIAGSNASIAITLNNWTHVALVRTNTSTNGTAWYINGVPAGTFVHSTNIGSGGTLYIASSGGSTYFLTGYLSDLKITNGSALYSNGFVPPVAPLTPTTTIGTNIYSSALLLNGTSGGIIDYHSTNILETGANTQLASEDPYAGGYYSNYFDGSGDTLTTANLTSGFSFGTGDWTIEFWINSTVTGRVDPFSWNYTFSSSGWASVLFNTLGGSGGVSGAITWYENAVPVTQASSTGWNDGTWKLFAVTRSGNSIRMFLNGPQIGTTYTTSFTYGAANSGLIIGASALGSNLTGSISNFRAIKGTALYTTTFTPPTAPLTAVANTVLLTCQSNSFKDNSTNNATITRNGDTSVKSFNPFQQNTGKSLYFDGTDDYAGIVNNPTINLAMGDYTAECWFYTTASNQIQTILWFNGNTSAYSSLRLGITNTSINFYVGADGSSWGINSGNIGTLIVNQWNHIAVTRSGADYKVFLNGTQIGSTYTAPATVYSTGTLSYIGALNNASGGTTIFRTFYGYITSVRITNGYARYTTTFTPPTEPFYTK